MKRALMWTLGAGMVVLLASVGFMLWSAYLLVTLGE